MVKLLDDMSAFGAFMHVAGSLCIVYGQTVVKMAHCIVESSAVAGTWTIPSTGPRPRWYVLGNAVCMHLTRNELLCVCGVVRIALSVCVSICFMLSSKISVGRFIGL